MRPFFPFARYYAISYYTRYLSLERQRGYTGTMQPFPTLVVRHYAVSWRLCSPLRSIFLYFHLHNLLSSQQGPLCSPSYCPLGALLLLPPFGHVPDDLLFLDPFGGHLPPPNSVLVPPAQTDPAVPVVGQLLSSRKRPERTPGLAGTNASFLVPDHIHKKL